MFVEGIAEIGTRPRFWLLVRFLSMTHHSPEGSIARRCCTAALVHANRDYILEVCVVFNVAQASGYGESYCRIEQF